jgi:hypothetical protein
MTITFSLSQIGTIFTYGGMVVIVVVFGYLYMVSRNEAKLDKWETSPNATGR